MLFEAQAIMTESGRKVTLWALLAWFSGNPTIIDVFFSGGA